MRTSKVLNNLNRGFLLSAAIVFCVALFLLLQGMADDKLEPELKAMAESFMAESDTAVVLPEEYRVFGGDSEEFRTRFMDYSQIVDDSSSVDNQFYSDNPQLRQYTLSWLQSCAGNQISNQNYITTFKTKIVKFKSFSVYKGKATLTFDFLCTGETLTAEGTNPLTQAGSDTLTFEKENGKWVITNYLTRRFDFLYYGNNPEGNA